MFKSFIFTFAFILAILIPVKGIILQDCSRYVAITKLFLPSQQVNGFTEKDSIQIKASNWKTCFLSCCNLPSCREVVYSEWLGCLHIKCSGAFGFCKYRPNELKDNSVHGIIIGVRNTDIPVSGQLDQFQFRNGPSLVTSAMRFAHVQQCAQYVEQENVTGVAKSWATKRFSPFLYLYQKPHRVPPLGMRSAVPLGGLGTGSFELRADGTFAEWTLENQSPGGSAKLGQGALDLAVIGVRVQTPKGVRASLLRTHPPQSLPGVNGISYSGGFPVSKLVVEDNGFFGVRMELFAYASLHARNATASALPAVFFTLRVYNPTSLQANVSLLLNLPLGEQPDTSREGFDFKVVNNVKLPSTCARLCQDQTKCKAWSLENGTCKLKDRMPLHAYKRGTTSGVKGFWGSSHESLTCGRPGRYPNSGGTTIMWVKNEKNNDNDNDDGDNSFEDRYDNNNRNYSYDSKKDFDKNRSRKIQYDVIKLPVDDNDNNKTNYNNYNTNNYDDNVNNKRENKKTKLKNKCKKEKIRKKLKTTKKEKMKNDKAILFSSAVSNDIKEIWSYFRKDGHLRDMVVKDTGFHGSGVSMMSLRPGEEGSITMVMAWHYPFRDHAGETVGQYYGNIFKSSKEVALRAKQNIHDVLNELLIWRKNMMPPKTPHKDPDPHEVFHVESSLPDWLQDTLVNSLSYWRTGFWVADGRWRQWETFDCNDVDSVHNDFQRELPYILFFPGLLENVVRAWANSQRPSGLIMEALQGQFGCWGKTNKLDSVGGRYNMADVNPAFIAQVYHLYVWAGKEKLLQDLWPAVRKATQWIIDEGTDGTGLPLRMTNTYDILQLQQYDHAFYNCVMFLLGLRAVEEMAEIQKDVDTYLLVRETIAKALEKIDQLFWDEERGYYHAWWDRMKGSPPWLMADSLYGQAWAYTLGLGNLLDPEKMKSHLYNEGLLNDTPYGLQVMTTNSKGRKDDSQKIRQKRDTTEEWKRYFELNQYYENLRQNRHSLSFSEVNYDGNENHATDLQPFSEGYENTLNIYQNQPYAYSLGQYGYGMNQKKDFRDKNSDWDKYFNTIYREKLPNINGYLTTNSLKGEKEPPRLQYQNWQSTSSVTSDGSWYDWPASSEEKEESVNAFTSRKVYESASLGHETKADTSEDPLEAKAIIPPKSILNDCSLLQKQALHRSIWMGASPDWTALQIHLGMDPYEALEQAKKSLLHYRNHLKDFWNIHGLTAGSDYGLNGQPWCTSHYTFHMVLWHIPFALSGQQYSIIERSLVFNPKVKVPYSLPFFLPYASGNIEAIPYGGGVSFKISVTHGYLVLKTLSVSGNVWPGKALKLEKGEFLIWS